MLLQHSVKQSRIWQLQHFFLHNTKVVVNLFCFLFRKWKKCNLLILSAGWILVVSQYHWQVSFCLSRLQWNIFLYPVYPKLFNPCDHKSCFASMCLFLNCGNFETFATAVHLLAWQKLLSSTQHDNNLTSRCVMPM